MSVRALRAEDWPVVAEIYREGIRDGAAFATDAPSWGEWDDAHPLRLVAERDGDVVGWAAVAPTSTRHVYRGVGRSAVYIAERARGRGIGRLLMEALVHEAERRGLWTIEAWMFPENVASVELHRRCGFRVVGTRERIGQRDGVWRDVVVMERRSREVG
ncbi:MAG: N-acetyltransferase family protein [Actinomycetota bacterium]|nr:N-acetyltransferase family protein [Actinomycetota bacterium]